LPTKPVPVAGSKVTVAKGHHGNSRERERKPATADESHRIHEAP
jgi:hypothetical protein